TGAHWHADLQILAAGTGAIALAAFGARFSAVTRLKTKIHQGIEAVIGNQPDAAAVTAVATVGTAPLDKLFPVKVHAAIAAIAGFDHDFCFINEFHGLNSTHKKALHETGLFDSGADMLRNRSGVCCLGSHYTYKGPVLWAFYLELHGAMGFREQGMILAQPYVFAGVETGATLTYQNVASQYFLTAVTLHAKAFGN